MRRKNTDNSFIGFNRQPANSINDGDYVVWQLLTIRTEPDSPMGEDSDDDRVSTPPHSRVSSPEVRLPDGIIRTNSRLARMAT